LRLCTIQYGAAAYAHFVRPMLNYSVFDRVLSKVVFVASLALAGALLVQPLALIVWVGTEHGGQHLPFLSAATWGALCGAAVAFLVLLVRYLYVRLFGARTA